MDNYELLSSTCVFEGRILKVMHDEIKAPTGAKWLREIVISLPACAVVPVDSSGDIILVRQYRHAVRRMTLEIPAGIVDPGETPEEAVLRELKEETGYTADSLTFLTGLHASIGFNAGLTRIYLARGITPGSQKLDPEELVTVHKFALSDVIDMIMRGKIQDSKTITGIMLYNRLCAQSK